MVEEIVEDIFRVVMPIPWENGSVNAYLIRGDTHWALVDCGMESPDSRAILEEAFSLLKISYKDIQKLVITHIHPDHYGAAGSIVQLSQAKLLIHRLEVPLVSPRYIEIYQLLNDVEKWLNQNGVPQSESSMLKEASLGMRSFVTPTEADIQLDGSETVKLGGLVFHILWTPGHSPGHICLYSSERQILLSGDTILSSISPNVGLHPQSTPNPLADFIESLRQIAALNIRLTLPGHGDPIPATRSVIEALIWHHEQRKSKIYSLIKGSKKTAWEVSMELFGPQSNPMEQRLALQETIAHLQLLAAQRKARKILTNNDMILWST